MLLANSVDILNYFGGAGSITRNIQTRRVYKWALSRFLTASWKASEELSLEESLISHCFLP